MKVIKRMILLILVLIGMVVFNILMMAMLLILQELILVPKDYLIWTVNSPTYPLVFILIGLLDTYILLTLGRFIKLFKSPFSDKVLLLMNTHKKAMGFVGLVILYIVFFNVTSVTETEIMHRTFYNPIGTGYEYSDVRTVETGVHLDTKRFSNHERTFYYIINLQDGTRVDLNGSGGEKGDDSYGMIEYVDEKLMNMNVKKVSSLNHIEGVALDQYYIDRFIRIIEN